MGSKSSALAGKKPTKNLHFISHPNEPKYKSMHSSDELRNPKNLFDDLNSEDDKWFDIAKKFIRKVRVRNTSATRQ